MEEISQFVSNVGFPIVACVFMYFNQKELNNSISELSSTLKGIDTRLDILEIAYEYGYPVIHMKQKCGFNEMNYENYYIDVIHPNSTTGRKRIIEVVKSGILSTIQ